jgi:thymidylate kinase
VRDGYGAIAKREPGRVVVVDASGEKGETQRRVIEAVQKKLKLGTRIND